MARPSLKTHKNPLKVRLIINTQGSVFYKIAKFVSKELKYLTTSAKSYIKDTEQFVNKVKEINLDENEKLVSFDIADMYPSLPKSEVIHEVERRIREDTFKTNVNKEALVRLVKISVEFMTFKIGNKFYNQADGLFIGSPASPCFAEIYIQRIEENSIYSMLHAPRIWLRKVDDTFTVTKHKTEDTLNELNNIHSKVKFTAEEEKDDQIPFLDCLIMRKDDNTVKTKVYKKPTHTGQYTNYTSNQPLHVKLSTIKTLTRRAKTICTEEADLKEELNYIQKTMQLNEFPKNIVTKTIKETLNKECNGRNQTDDDTNSIRLFLPYEKGISEQIARDNESGVVYKVTCGDCGKYYIGETGRKLTTRIKEHKNGAKIKKTSLECPNTLKKQNTK
ncbi:uncharacterized protein LOC130642235 [Hydractinia symbiolongicarpus]|uniref:uncharacterized protein LOC130642235 n=1 Tax=Hydractinia symbiolongicarpus TaxID=13093 RepID=UPI00254FF5E2|nr:uncharacterized protein LOC130642235 [Hydractinia symbiolongicarpus]